MRLALASAAVVLAVAASAQTTMFGKTKSEALAMGLDNWNKLAASSRVSDSRYASALSFYEKAARARNDRLMAKLPSARRRVLLAVRSGGSAAADAIAAAEGMAGSNRTKHSTDAIRNRAWLEEYLHRILTKAKMPEGLYSGNLFAEIEDGWKEQVEEAAKASRRTTRTRPLITKALAASRRAKDAFNRLEEGENILMRQLLANFFNPETFVLPDKDEQAPGRREG